MPMFHNQIKHCIADKSWSFTIKQEEIYKQTTDSLNSELSFS